MNEKVKDILNRLKEFWNKYTSKQKTAVISILLVAIAAIGLLAWVFSQPNWVELVVCEDATQVKQVQEILTGNSIAYEISNDARTVNVEKEKLTEAKILIGSSNIKASGYSLDDALDVGFSGTEADKTKRYKLYLEEKLSEDLIAIDGIKDARVTIDIPESSSVIIATQEEKSVGVVLILEKDIGDDTAESIAQFIKTAVGNKNTEKVTIISNTGALLYSGINSGDNIGSVVNQQKYTAAIVNTMVNSLKNMLISMPMYDDADIDAKLHVDYDSVTEIAKQYESQEEPVYSQTVEEYYKSEGAATGGIPGTDSNDDETDYLISNGSGGYVEQSVKKYNFLPNELVRTTIKTPGEVIYDDSSISIVLHDNVVYDYEAVKAQGLLKDISWDEFKEQHSNWEQLEVSAELLKLVAYGTGIDEDSIQIIAYRVPYFYEPTESGRDASFYVQLVIVIIIVLLLAFVVIRSARPVEVSESEPELSVEQMLASTREKQEGVDDINLQDKSDVRKAIEKFVDENPEAVALLLRNWIDEGWE
ncbi:MAG: flagellar M-ring protein FliF [Lachnospiraceae bacterium]|nr:flagellar M-ring protein FliF [Lachnospiraceae bacterium]